MERKKMEAKKEVKNDISSKSNNGDFAVVREFAGKVLEETKRIMVGKDNEIKLVLMSILADGHVLLEDVPGSGKTTLVKVLAKALGLDSGRIQFVPDLLPSDITGMVIYNQKTGEFEYREGPVMTNILLADEINRAIPRTQAALLEAMEERQVTIDNKAYSLPEPFLVLATQNPIEMESTFKLPAAQMDRFLIKLSLGYLKPHEEVEMLQRLGDRTPLETVEAVTNASEITTIQGECEKVYLSEKVAAYIVNLVNKTRDHGDLHLGVSPRGSKALYKASKVWAAMDGRSFVTPDDVKAIAMPVLLHRIMLTPEARHQGIRPESIITKLLETTPVGGDTDDVLNEI